MRAMRAPVLLALAGVAVVTIAVLSAPSPLALGGDNETLTHPLLADAWRQLRAGTLPLWTVGRWGGSPLAGDPVVGALYLPRYLGYLLTAPPHLRALDIDACLHLGLLAVGVVWFLRGLDVPRAAALAGAVLVASSPTLVYVARSWAQYWDAMAWWPWLLGAVVRLAGAPSGAMLRLLASVALAAQVWAGYPQFALYSGTVALLWLVLAPGPDRGWRIVAAALVGVGAVGLAAPPMLAGLPMAGESVRSGPAGSQTITALDVFALPLGEWPGVLRTAPTMPRSAWKIVPAALVLAVLALLRRDGVSRGLGVAAAVAAVLATAPAVPFRLLHSIPPWSLFAGPIKCFYLVAFLVPLLAGTGLAQLATMSGALARVALAAVALASIAPWRWDAAIVAAVVAALVPPRHGARVAALLVVGSAVGFLVGTRALDAPQPFPGGEYAALLRRDPTTMWPDAPAGRWVAIVEHAALRQAGMNFGALWGLSSLSGVGPLSPWRQIRILEDAVPGRAPEWLRQLGAAVVVVQNGTPLEAQLRRAGFAALAPMVGLRAMTPPLPPSRFVLVPRVVVVSAEEAVAAGRAGTAFGDEVVLVEDVPPQPDGDAGGTIAAIETPAGHPRASITVARPTWLVVREPYYPGWVATVDGVPVPIARAGGFFLGLVVPAGTHDVALRYEQRGLGTGLLVALVTLLGLPFVPVRRRADRAAPSAASP